MEESNKNDIIKALDIIGSLYPKIEGVVNEFYFNKGFNRELGDLGINAGTKKETSIPKEILNLLKSKEILDFEEKREWRDIKDGPNTIQIYDNYVILRNIDHTRADEYRKIPGDSIDMKEALSFNSRTKKLFYGKKEIIFKEGKGRDSMITFFELIGIASDCIHLEEIAQESDENYDYFPKEQQKKMRNSIRDALNDTVNEAIKKQTENSIIDCFQIKESNVSVQYPVSFID